MEKLIALIEKGKPFFSAIARNKYLKAIRDGFISVMPIIIVSSIFLLVSAVPNVWGFYWPAEINDVLMKAYNYSMGIVGICAAATTAKHFCDAQNRDLPKNNQINFISVMIASLIGFLLLSSDAISFTDNGVSISGLANGYMGSKGLLTAFICAFATGIIYKFFIKRNITIKMPEQVPPNISQTFKDIIPFGVCLVFFWGFDFAFRNIFGFCFAQGVIQVFQPLFSAADGYVGLAIIYGAMSLFWFVGVHGPSIIEPAISAALISNLELNMAMYQAGEHATAVLTKPLQDFVVAMGGTGATLVICFMFAFLAKSKEMRAVGRASAVPVCFGVNEPFLFGAPMVLNPIFFIPFIFAPIANIWITKFFIDGLGMNGFMFSLPWTTPAPLGIAMGLGLQPLAFLLIPALLIVDFLIYFPFFKVYDREKCAEEAEADQAEVAQRAAQKQAAMNAASRARRIRQASPPEPSPRPPRAWQQRKSAPPANLWMQNLRVMPPPLHLMTQPPAPRPAPPTWRATPMQRSTAVVSLSCAREAEPPACSPTHWPRPLASTASTLRPQQMPTAAIWTSCRTLTLLSWRPRQRLTSTTSRPTASAWASLAASPAASSTSTSPATARHRWHL